MNIYLPAHQPHASWEATAFASEVRPQTQRKAYLHSLCTRQQIGHAQMGKTFCLSVKKAEVVVMVKTYNLAWLQL